MASSITSCNERDSLLAPVDRARPGRCQAGTRRAHPGAREPAGWDRVHATLRITKPFYGWFTPAISVRDFAFRRGDLSGALDLLAVLRP